MSATDLPDGMLAGLGRGEAEHLRLARRSAVAHLLEQPLGTEQRRLHAVLVEAAVLADSPELRPAQQAGKARLQTGLQDQLDSPPRLVE